MPSQFDPSDFVDSDFQASRSSPFAAPTLNGGGGDGRGPSREEVEAKVSEAQLKLAELKRAQEELERERASLEETRRRQMEFQNGRNEMLQNLTRGVTLLSESEFSARRDAEEMAKALAALKEASEKVQSLNEQNWNKESYHTELTRALAIIENSRMEWNSARLKFSVLSANPAVEVTKPTGKTDIASVLATQSFSQLCRIGFALTWPLALVALGIFAVLVLKH